MSSGDQIARGLRNPQFALYEGKNPLGQPAGAQNRPSTEDLEAKRGRKGWSGSFFWECTSTWVFPGRVWRHTLSMEGERNKVGTLWAVQTRGFSGGEVVAGCSGSHAPHKPSAARLLASLSVPLSPAVLNRDPNPLRKSISTAQSRDTQSSSPSSQATSRWQNEKKPKISAWKEIQARWGMRAYAPP